jgi:transcriptional regulator with XRE-family HTH domain
MYILDNILFFLNKRNMTKKEFAQKLINLEPRVGLNLEIPSERTIYLYLQRKREIKADLIPFIADVFNITEQELFDTSTKTRKKCFKYFLQNASKDELEYFNNFINSQIQNNININYGSVIMNSKDRDEKIEEFIELLKYAPDNFIDKVLDRLEEYRRLDGKEI